MHPFESPAGVMKYTGRICVSVYFHSVAHCSGQQRRAWASRSKRVPIMVSSQYALSSCPSALEAFIVSVAGREKNQGMEFY